MQRRYHMMRRPAVLAGCLLSLLLSACGEGPGDAGDSIESSPATPVAATDIQPRDLSRELRLSGVVEPRAAVRLASRTSGNIERVEVEEGDRVENGQLLVQLDTREQRAELARAEAEAEQAELDYRRQAELRERGMISQQEYQRARVTRRMAESARELWAARVDFGELRAPRDAVVTARHVEPGEAVDAQEVLLELAALDELVIRLGVSELDVVHLESGQTVPVRLDAFRDNTLEGRIRRIFPAANPDSRLITVEIALPGDAAERGVRPGYLGRVNMIIDRREDTLAVPAAAVGEDGERRYVYVVEDETLQRRVIEAGVQRGQWREVLDGLEAGDIVLATNPIDMREGQRVRIVGWRG